MTDVHLDWLSATTALDLNSVIDALATRVCIASTKVIRPRNRGYSSALQLFDLSGDSIATVEFGRGAPRTLVISTGAEPNDLVRGALAGADSAAQSSLQSVERQYLLGAASYLQLLVAQQQAQRMRTSLVAAQAQRLVDSVALYQALGGGVSLGD